ncbi:hypothetical protein Droror1_Dr00017773, partial [Drosera rotundifolia]
EGGAVAAIVPARRGWTQRRLEAATVERSGVVMYEVRRVRRRWRYGDEETEASRSGQRRDAEKKAMRCEAE